MKPYSIIKIQIFPANLHVCFSEAAFKQLLKDKNIPTKIEMLEGGALAEVHSMQTIDGKTVLAVLFDWKSLPDENDSHYELEATVVHESVHIFHRIMEYCGEETPGEEIRAYATEYIFKELMKVIDDHKKRNGKKHRKLLEQKNQAVIGALIQMAEQRNGGAGSDSSPEGKDLLRGAEDGGGQAESETRTGF